MGSNFKYLQNFLPNFKRISQTFIYQLLIQVIGLISGVLIIRYLDIKEYAIYTIANTLLGTMILIGDGGVTTGMLTLGGKVYNNKIKLGDVVTIGIFIRKKLAILSLLAVLPILIYLINKNEKSIYYSFFIAICIIPAFWAALTSSIYEIVLKLNSDIISLQKLQFLIAIFRLSLILLSLIYFPLSIILLLAFGIPQILANGLLRKRSSTYAQMSDSLILLENNEILTDYKKIVLKTMPGIIYYCFSSQILIWILSLSGKNLEIIGQFGALSRIGILFGLIQTSANLLLIPKIAKLPYSYTLLRKEITKFSLSFISVCFLLSFFLIIFSNHILYIFGASYQKLNFQFNLVVLNSILGTLVGYLHVVSNSRGWIISPYFSITYNLFSIIAGVYLFDLKTLNNALIFNIFISTTQFILTAFFLIYSIYKSK